MGLAFFPGTKNRYMTFMWSKKWFHDKKHKKTTQQTTILAACPQRGLFSWFDDRCDKRQVTKKNRPAQYQRPRSSNMIVNIYIHAVTYTTFPTDIINSAQNGGRTGHPPFAIIHIRPTRGALGCNLPSKVTPHGIFGSPVLGSPARGASETCCLPN